MAGRYDFTIEQGATFSRTLALTDSSGDVFPLTGYSARMQIRKTYDSTILADSTDNLTLTISEAEGLITMTMNATETAKLDETEAIYDLEIENDAVTTRLIEGNVTISREVTK